MATEKPRFTITVDDDLFDKIEDFRFDNRYNTRSEAVSALLQIGIKALEEQEESNKKGK